MEKKEKVTQKVFRVLQEDAPVLELPELHLQNVLASLKQGDDLKVIFFNQTQSLSGSIPCIGILLQKQGPVLQIIYPYVLVFEQAERGDTEDIISLFPYTGTDLTAFKGEATADGILHINADTINNGYILYSGLSNQVMVTRYISELENVVKYLEPNNIN